MLLNKVLQNYHIILGSQSPRRNELLKSLAIDFEKRVKEVDETIDTTWKTEEVAEKLAERKALAQQKDLHAREILLTADTIVVIDNQILNKPQNAAEAKQMLKLLSNNVHSVITGVCLCSKDKIRRFSDTTNVFFRTLSEEEIDFYIQNYQPYDKAGAYGAQEWMGMVAIERMEGSYFNVMGLPVHRLYSHLIQFII